MRRVRIRTVVLIGAGIVVVWLAAAAWMLADAGRAMREGQQRLSSVRADATATSFLDGDTDRRLADAEDRFARARTRLRSPLVAPLRIVPVLGRHLRAGDDVVATAQGSTEVVRGAVAGLQALSERDLAAGPGRVEILRDLSELVGTTATDLAALDPGTGDGLAGPVARAVDDLKADHDGAVEGLQRAHRTVEAVADLLDGPRTYLLIGANNAEMRAGSGMFLSTATLHFQDGSMNLGDVRPTASLVLPAGSVATDGDLARNWPWLDVGRDLRSLGLTADFPQNADVARRFWAEVPDGGEVDGVIVVDVDALRELLRVVGPVEVDGITYTTDTVRGELLKKQYQRSGDDHKAVADRRDRLGDVAWAVFERIEDGDWSLDELATALVDVVQRRHLMIWSADGDTQEAWTSNGADGRLRDDSVSVALVNRGAEKLDAYLDTAATITTGGGPTGREIEISYRITNRAPAEGPRYQLGPNIEGLVAGEHLGIVVVNLPAGTTGVALDGARLTLSGGDGPTVVVAGEIGLQRGASTTVTVTATLPDGLARLVVEPSARIPKTSWEIDDHVYELDRRRTVTLGD